MGTYIFIFLAALTILSGLMVVFSKNPIHSVLYLIVCFFTIAGHYIMLQAEFLAVVHIIVYTGAIMVLFLFVIMLLNLNKDSERHKGPILQFASVISACALGIVVLAASKDTAFAQNVPVVTAGTGAVKNIGQKLFTDFLLPFEICSVLFLSAMIGVVLISKKEKV
jgi:NADH-quinone oxidoreductase subunit J